MISWPDEITDRVGEIKFDEMGISHSIVRMHIIPRAGSTLTRVVSAFYVTQAQGKPGPLRDMYIKKIVRIIDDAIAEREEFEAEWPEEKAVRELVKKYAPKVEVMDEDLDGFSDSDEDEQSGDNAP